MTNSIVKNVGGSVAILGDALNIISNTILESRREEAKTERLEIKARAYICEKIEETKRELARLQLEDNKDRRLHEERIKELNNQFIRDFCEYNLQLLSLVMKNKDRQARYDILNRQLNEINENERRFIELYEKNPYNKSILEYLKSIMDNKQRILNDLIKER